MNAPFNPGDRVVRVGDNDPGAILHPMTGVGKGPKKDTVHCVDQCFPSPNGLYWQVWIVGWPHNFWGGLPCGWPAHAFRKVEEVGHPLSAAQLQEAK
jgi:hypothetical protein